jgi:hypothetical protein
MNLKMEKYVNFNIIKVFLLKNTLDLDFEIEFSTAHFVVIV